jgi:gliding motility-associated-like protein
MKTYIYPFVFFVCLGFLFTHNTCKAQYVLNGSFEDNTMSDPSIPSSVMFNFFKNIECRVSFISTNCPNCVPANFLKKDTLPEGWIDNPNINSNGYIIRPAPHGKTYILLRNRSFWGQNSQVIFLLSDTLKKGKRYNISLYASFDRDYTTANLVPFIVGLGKDKYIPDIEVDSFYLKDSTYTRKSYRRYVMSTIVEDNYKYIFLYLGQGDILWHMADDIRLDTCVTMLPTKYKSCATFPDTLKPSTIGKKYYWSTGDTTQNITIYKTGNYRAYVYDSLGCCSIDSFVVIDYALNGMVTPIQLCTGNTQILSAKAATGTVSYKWNTSDTTQNISITKGGNYWVTRNVNKCSITDTFIVTEHPLPIINLLPDTTVCFSKIAQILLDAGPFKSYLWKPTNETGQIIYANRPLQYLLQVTDSNNCVMSKQITVAENCEEHVYIPNAFSPNGDGINDVFNIVTTGVESYEMQIFNRWGIQVFSSQNYLQGWDGKNAPNDVYVVQITYKLKGKPTETVKQNVTLMR